MVVNQTLNKKVIVITGASRGIGLAIAKRAARDGACIAILAKTAEAQPNLEGTIYTAAKEIEEAGGEALPIVCDIRSEENVVQAIQQVIQKWNKIDVLINNASAISMTDSQSTTMKRYDLMNQVNGRGTFLCSKVCIPHLKESKNGHILSISPPLIMDPIWFGPHVAYSIAKYNMSMCTLGLAEELKPDHIAVNSLWPRTAVATAAVNNVLGGTEMMQLSKVPEMMAEAAYLIITGDSNSEANTGNFYIDDEVLEETYGLPNTEHYSVTPGAKCAPDFFVNPLNKAEQRELVVQEQGKQQALVSSRL
jgi:citronellol/citronellal dehydrogenase